VEDALGATIQPPSREFGRGQNRAPAIQNFTVIGIYADPGELRRKSYGVADLVVPYTSILPAGVDVRMAERFLLGNLAMRVEGVKFETAEAQLRESLSREYGEDLVLEVWEGTPRGENDTIAEARQTVNIFSLVVNILGFVLLITGSIGILSIMLVEILGRTKEISLERAMGASRSAIVREYFSRSVILTLISVAAGIVLSIVFSRPLTQILAPLFDTLSIARGGGGVLDPFAVLVGSAVALIIGGIFGVFPVLSTLKLNIADGIREV
jgi:ABC-type lipoprotein release transport system permease subunit